MSSTPRAKPMVASDKVAASPRAAKPAAEKKPKAKKADKGKPSIKLGMTITADVDSLSAEDARVQLQELQKAHAAMVILYENLKTENINIKRESEDLQKQMSEIKGSGSSDEIKMAEHWKTLYENTLKHLSSEESKNLSLNKKINALQIEVVNEAEVDQIFAELEKYEVEVDSLKKTNAALENEVLTARQMSARGNATSEPKFIEIHHHASLSDDEDEADDAAAPVEVK